MKTKLLFLLLAVLALPGSSWAQGTAFTYQGRLMDADAPATGLYDFVFTVYDTGANGNVVAGPISRDAVAASDGLFNVSLDFGAGVFEGMDLWLEISVRPSGVGDPTVLEPRTPLLPAPYAIFATKAGRVADGILTAEQLNSGGIPPTPGQFLSYDGANFLWADPGVAVGNTWLLNGTSTYYNAGNVGIGTANPTAKLDVRGSLVLDPGGSPALYTGTGNAELNRYLGLLNSPTLSSASGLKAGGILVADSYAYANPGKNDLIVKSRIGVGTPTPGSRLTVKTLAGSVFDAYGIEHTDGTVRLTTYLDGASGQLGTRSNHPLGFFVNDGLPSLSLDAGGNVFITPNGGVGGYGSTIFGAPNGESGMSIRGANRADVRFNGSSLKLVAGPGVGPPSSFNGIAVHTSGNVGIGTDAPVAKLDVRGTTRTCVLTITGGCDLAEPFPIKEGEIAKGSVVVIDEEHPGRLKRSTQAYDTRVAGIISGANGVNPGITLKQEGVLDQGENVALSGRVYVRADATHGAIKPGDLLTTSDTPGHAMKVRDHSRAHGAILGKAMGALPTGQGMVLVLVSLH